MAIRWDNTYRTMIEAKKIRLENAPSGNQTVKFNVGDIVTTTGTGQLKPGIKVKIEDFYIENGYVYYFGCGMWNRQQDLQ